MAIDEQRLAEIMKSLQTASHEVALANVNKVHDSLCTLTDDDIPKLQEHYFISHFLPYFTGEKKLADNAEVMPTWLAIAGSPVAEVGIVDDNDVEKILFKVPGIYDTSLVDPLKDSDLPSLNKIYSAHAIESNHIKMVADRVLLGRLIEKSDEFSSEINNEKERRWLDIFARYGKSPVITQSSQVENTSEKPDASSDDGLIYE